MTTFDISEFILNFFSLALSWLYSLYAFLDHIIILHVGEDGISLFDFALGMLILEFIFGVFYFFSPTLKGGNDV